MHAEGLSAAVRVVHVMHWICCCMLLAKHGLVLSDNLYSRASMYRVATVCVSVCLSVSK